MMGAFGPILFLFLPLAGQGNDLVTLIDAADYFKSRQIEVKVEQLVKLAGTKPQGSADSIAQLLAIRWLGEHPEETKKAKARDVLEQVAGGKVAGDAQGFAKEYAQRALARLDGKPLTLRAIPENSIRGEALQWFPDSCDFLFAADVRNTLKEALGTEASLVQMVRATLPVQQRELIWNFADTVGNVRVDRISLGLQLDPQGQRPEEIYMRFTGLGDRARLAKYLFVLGQAKATTEEKGPNGEPITLIDFQGQEPGVALVGDTDLIVAGRRRPKGDSLAIVQAALQVRAGKKPSALKGPLAGLLKDVPATASVLMAGRPVEELLGPVAMRGGPQPQRLLASATVGKTVDLRFEANLGKADEAKEYLAGLNMLKDQALAGLKGGGLPLTKETIAAFQKTLESIKIEATGTAVKGAAQTTGDLHKLMEDVVRMLTKEAGLREPPPDPR